jgi:predicted DsbA family dithiol-disulfide isomerase
MKIELWSDFACPFCYIGKTRFENALAKFPHKKHVEVVYKAYQLNPNAPKVMKGSPAEAFAKGHRMTKDQALQRFEMFKNNAKTVGLEYNYEDIQMTNTFDAHRLAKWANQFDLEQDITSRFMKAYFTDGMNLADHETLISLVKEVGLDADAAKIVLKGNDFADEVQSQITEGRQVGVQGVPFFVLNRKYGVSGAQQEAYFTQVLEKLWEEEKPLETIGESDGPTCNDETCEI